MPSGHPTIKIDMVTTQTLNTDLSYNRLAVKSLVYMATLIGFFLKIVTCFAPLLTLTSSNHYPNYKLGFHSINPSFS